MKTFNCVCNQRLYLEDTQCPSCKSRLGWCPACDVLSALEETAPNQFHCRNANCNAALELCRNYVAHDACNRCVIADGEVTPFCDMCQFDDAIPDLTDPVKLECFRRLQVAKRRVLNQFRVLGLPPYSDEATQPALSFDFKADAIPTEQGWRPMGGETVYTGHASGKITINIREADSVERERMRVKFGESYRTLIGHFRHELGHYLWDTWIGGSEHEADFVEVFGNHNAPTYSEALSAYYQNGPKENWEEQYITAYASMHPFEDWAETTAILLNAHATIETAVHYGMLARTPADADPGARLEQFIYLGDFLNEVSREMGLLDVMPGTITDPVRRKMEFIRRVLQKEGT